MRFLFLLIGNICLCSLIVEDSSNPLLWITFVALGLLYVTGELK